MIRITTSARTGKNVKRMLDMEPLEIGTIVKTNRDSTQAGHVVMRTSSTRHFEVMDLTDPKVGGCWTNEPSKMVELLPVGEAIMLEVSNENPTD